MVLLEYKHGSKFMPTVAQETILLKVKFVATLEEMETIHAENVQLVGHSSLKNHILDFTVFLK